MKREHAAIIAKARRDGLKPVELASELMGYTLVEAMRDCIASHAIAYKNMSQVQQDSCIQQMTEAVKEAIDLAIQTIASAGTRTVRMDLTSVAVGKKLKVAGVVAGTEEYKHDLIDLANDQGTAIVILNERDYLQGLDGIQGEKDQRDLPIDSDAEPEGKPAKAGKDKAPRVSSPTSAATLANKATELPPKLLQDARDFITNQQVCTVSGIQNGLKIGAVKATAVLEQMAAEGLVVFVGDSKSGEYQLKRDKSPADKIIEQVADPVDEALDDLTFDGEDDSADDATLTDELYAKIKAYVIKSGKFSVGSVLVTLGIDSDVVVEEAAIRMEREGLLTEENEMGLREIVQAA
jgi:ribosomal protein S25